MAHGTRINGTSYGVTGGKCLVNGTAYGIKKGRTLASGTGYDITFGTALGSYPEGDIVKINENGSPVEFYVVKHNYESGLNGAGGTLVLRVDCHSKQRWSLVDNRWAASVILEWLNNTYKSMLDSSIQNIISLTKYYYTIGGGSDSITTRSDYVFLLSGHELGKTYYGLGNEGSTVPNPQKYQIAKLYGLKVEQWTRSPYTSFGDKYTSIYLKIDGDVAEQGTANQLGARPAFVLPSSTLVGADGVIK